MRLKIIAIIITAMVMAVGSSMAIGPSVARADSGSCAVRAYGPIFIGGSQFLYEVRNRCGHWIRVRIALPRYGYSSSFGLGCKSVAPYGSQDWLSPRADPTWVIRFC